jgi:hypothetical protein
MDRPHLDDQPLTIIDAMSPTHGMFTVANRVAAHLGPSWEVRIEHQPLAMVLHDNSGRRLRMHYDYKNEQHLVALFALDHHGKAVLDARMNLFQLPSHMAAHLKEHVLPKYRRHLDRMQHEQDWAKAQREAQRGHAAAVAERLGGEWQVANNLGGLRVERAARGRRVFGEINWWVDGHLSIELGHMTPELVEHLIDGLAEHLHRHETNRTPLGKRPKRLNYLLELMVAAGYRIDKLGLEHQKLFGDHLFKMDNHAGVGYPLVQYLFERPGTIDTAIRTLEEG